MPKVEPPGSEELKRLVFFGTPEFAVPTLEALCEADLEPALVVSQPSRPVGRRRRVEPPPVVRAAHDRGLVVEQPESVSEISFLDGLRRLEPDVAVVVAFGQIFPRSLLEIPRLGCVNLHASLLPRHRGAAPIQAAIAAGDTLTGVTTMLMGEGLDSGPVLLRREVAVEPSETAGELAERLAELGAALTVETLARLGSGSIEPRPQDEEAATYAPRLGRADGELDWTRRAESLERRVRAYDPWPGTFTRWGDERIKILAAGLGPVDTAAAPGRIVTVAGESLVVACGDGTSLVVHRWQRPGRRPVSGRELADALGLGVGDRFV